MFARYGWDVFDNNRDDAVFLEAVTNGRVHVAAKKKNTIAGIQTN